MEIVCFSPPVSIQHQTGDCCVLRAHQLRRLLQQGFREAGGRSDANRQIQNVLGKLHKSAQHRTSAGKHDAGARLPFVSGVTDFVLHEMHDLFGARLDDVAQHGLRDRARVARSHSGDFEYLVALGDR